MQIKTFFVTGILFAFIILAHAQNKGKGSIGGRLTDENQNMVSSATVKLLPIGKGAKTDHQGNFFFEGLLPGNYTLKVSALGFKEIIKNVTLSAEGRFHENFQLEPDSRSIDEISITGLSKHKQVNQQAYNVTAIDAKKLYNTTMDIGQALNRVSGVRLRESGGVGSNMSFSLNGFSGNQVKMFLDGLPMDNFGSSFQLNNIPINFADRVEVYRGVVPVWLGGDALGGAVNIVTKTEAGKYLDASYSFGSFNTHKTNINAGYIDQSGLTLQLNAFQNYSDNNYKVNIQVPDPITKRLVNQRVRRFHDNYHNETLVANIGVSHKKYADQLLMGITLGNNRAEIQTGNDMQDVYGARETRGKIVQPGIKYLKKNLFVEGLNVSLNGRFNFGEERSIDTVPRLFNWLGESTPKNKENAPGGEATYTDFKYKNNIGLVSANATYDISDKHGLMLNHQFSTFNRKGVDAIQPDLKENKYPKTTRKYVTGLGYRMALTEKWNTNLFVKHYYQKAISQNVVGETDPIRTIVVNKMGYGLAATYFLQTDLQLKLSYEKAYRLPGSNELFGDLINQSDNPNLRPESSDNINLGLSYFVKLNNSHRISIDANYVYRYAKDYIRAMVGDLQPSGRRDFHFENLRSVTNNSVDANVRYYYKNLISLGGNMTYQNLINTNKVEPGKSLESDIYKDRLPNVPYLYGNADANIYFNNLHKKGDMLSIGYNLLYVHQFSLNWEAFGGNEQRYIIPQQLSHDVNVVYTMASGKYNIAFECLNLTDVTRYDNFALQKPSRSFNLKLRYFIKKS